MVKKLFSFLLAMLLLLVLTACKTVDSPQVGESTVSSSPTDGAKETTGSAAATKPTETQPEETQPGPKVLYCCVEEKTTMSDGTGPVVTRTFDAKGNKLTENDTFSDGSPKFSVTFTYNEQGKVLTEKSIYGVDGTGYLSTNTYNDAGQLIRNDYVGIGGEAVNRVTEYTYDSVGKATKEVVTETDGMKNEYTYTYDAVGNLLRKDRKVINLDGFVPQENYELYTYDSNGNKLTWCDERGFKKEWTYDDRGNLLSATETDCYGTVELTLRYTYDDQNRCLTETWSKGDKVGGGQTSVYKYDDAGRKIACYICSDAEDIANAHLDTEYIYDEAGNLLSEKSSGKIKEYKYIAIELPKE